MVELALEEAMTELKTIADIIRWGTSRFNEAGLCYGHGYDNAWDEAVALALHALNLPPDTRQEVSGSRLTTSEKQSILALYRRRVEERIPTAYLTHKTFLSGLEFFVDQRVLIPRSPIAELIEQQFAPWIDPHQVENVLDLCTGSGCIGIACAYAFPEAKVYLSDLSKEALEVAEINRQKHDLDEQVELIHSDLFTSVPNIKFDIIVSNPPYVDKQDLDSMPPEFHHEPISGLAAGEDGLDFAVKILQQAKNYLSEHGILIVEVGNSSAAMIERFPELPFVWLEFEHGGHGVFLLTAKDLK